ncbi:hypothetical protein [Streptomyces mexicanus]|uniref:hypothetical protein n=1 Tax=Streptomyces mexicanus TaxID=178566 RepID=UPI00365B832A
MDSGDDDGQQPGDPERISRSLPDITEAEERAGTLGQYIDCAGAAAEAGVHDLVVDFEQTQAGLAERVDLAARFIEGPRRQTEWVRPECGGAAEGCSEHVPRPRCPGHGMPNARWERPLQRPDSRNEPPRLRRVRIPGTVPIPPATSAPPREAEEEPQAAGKDGPAQETAV